VGELLGRADIRGRCRGRGVLSRAAAERAGLDPQLAEDVLLLGRVQGGDREAFAALFDRHAPVVLGLLVRILGSRPEAEEVLQEVFLQAWRQAARYDPGRSTPRGWLLVLARSRALDLVRSRESRRRREAETSVAPEVAPVGTAELEERERRSQVSSALGLLPNEQRRCIELAFFEGLTHTQIARRLDAPLGTIKSRIHLGMSKLRQVLSTP
jgi:RNA polymerase sigma-70 factor (ECF subfamily)